MADCPSEFMINMGCWLTKHCAVPLNPATGDCIGSRGHCGGHAEKERMFTSVPVSIKPRRWSSDRVALERHDVHCVSGCSSVRIAVQ